MVPLFTDIKLPKFSGKSFRRICLSRRTSHVECSGEWPESFSAQCRNHSSRRRNRQRHIRNVEATFVREWPSVARSRSPLALRLFECIVRRCATSSRTSPGTNVLSVRCRHEAPRNALDAKCPRTVSLVSLVCQFTYKLKFL